MIFRQTISVSVFSILIYLLTIGLLIRAILNLKNK